MPVGVDDFPLLIEDIIVIQEMLTHVEVIAFDLHLSAADGLGDQAVFYGNVFIQAGPGHYRLDALSAEALHEFVLQGNKELGTARVALTPGPAPKLVIDTPGVVVLGSQYV